MVPKLDPDKCRVRNLKAAAEGRSAVPMTLKDGPPPPPDGYAVTRSSGALPANPAAALAMVNERLAESNMPPLEADQVLFCYPEAANQNYVHKYSMFLGLSTLKNIVASAQEGVSFMNSHRTGGMSTPTELPYGSTFCGSLQTLIGPSGEKTYRAVLGVYFQKGLYPNGTAGPSTDDMHAAIKGGTIGDVSVGMKPSNVEVCICDVCGRDTQEMDEDGAGYICPHLPGTHKSMTAEEVKAQKARGVPDGTATYTLENGDINEVSAVFAGALPGAGFRKARKMVRLGQLGADDYTEVRRSMACLRLTAAEEGRFFSAREDHHRFTPDQPAAPPASEAETVPVDPVPATIAAADQPPEGTHAMAHPTLTLADVIAAWKGLGQAVPLADLAKQLGVEIPASTPPAGGAASAANPTPATFTQQPVNHNTAAQLSPLEIEVQQLREQLEMNTRQQKDNDARQHAQMVKMTSDAWVDSVIRMGRATPAERVELVSLYCTAANDDRVSPVQVPYRDPKDNSVKQGSRVDVLKASIDRRQATATSREVVAGNGEYQEMALSTINNAEAPTGEQAQLESIYSQAAAWGTRRNGANGTGPRGAAAAR